MFHEDKSLWSVRLRWHLKELLNRTCLVVKIISSNRKQKKAYVGCKHKQKGTSHVFMFQKKKRIRIIWFICFKISQTISLAKVWWPISKGSIFNLQHPQQKGINSVVNNQGHLPHLKQQMRIKFTILPCRLTSFTKCSKKGKAERKNMHFVSLNRSKRELIQVSKEKCLIQHVAVLRLAVL